MTGFKEGEEWTTILKVSRQTTKSDTIIGHFRCYPPVTLFACRDAPAQLVEEVEQHHHVNRALLLGGCLWSGNRGEALAVGVQIQIPYSCTEEVHDLCVGPGARFVCGERIALCGIGGGHDPVVQSLVKQFPAVTRPDRVPAAVGDLPLAGPRGCPSWERPHIHLVASRFAGRISDPPAIR